jgi:transposase
LWPDYGRRPDFLYGKAGKVLVELYDCDPVLIERNGWDRFRREMLDRSRFHDKTLKEVWSEVLASILHIVPAMERSFLSDRIKDLYSDWRRHFKRKERLKGDLIELYKSLDEYTKLCDVPVSDYQMAKLIAETGPLADFRHGDQLIRYAGLNLCRNSSGSWVGQTKISKKGRGLLRKILYQIAFSTLVTKKGIYSEFYARKKEDLKFGKKAMVCIMRKFLKMVHGVAKSAIAFDPKRVQTCESEYLKAA